MFFFTGVAFAVVVALLVAEFAVVLGGLAVVLRGVGPGVDFTVLAGLEATGVPVPPSFLGAFFTGVTPPPAVLVVLVAAVPVVVVGFEALLTTCLPVEAAGVAVFLRGVAVDFVGVAVTGAFRTGIVFCVPRGVLGLGVIVL